MAYVGNQPAEKYTSLTRQTFSSPTGTSFTLDHSVTNSDDLLLYINNVKQDPADYTASGTSLTTPTLVSGDEMYALFYGRATETVSPPDSSVSTAKIANNAVDETKLKDALIGDFTEVTVQASDSFLLGDGDGTTKRDTVQGILDLTSTITAGTLTATTSGTSVDITGIPSGTKRVTVLLDDVSTSGTSPIIIRLGDAGGIESTGYAGNVTMGSGTDYNWGVSNSFAINDTTYASWVYSAKIILTLTDSSTNLWTALACAAFNNGSDGSHGCGNKALSAELTQIRLTTVGGSDTFDAGNINIVYE